MSRSMMGGMDLQGFRRQLRVSQAELGEILGVTRWDVSRIERAVRPGGLLEQMVTELRRLAAEQTVAARQERQGPARQ